MSCVIGGTRRDHVLQVHFHANGQLVPLVLVGIRFPALDGRNVRWIAAGMKRDIKTPAPHFDNITAGAPSRDSRSGLTAQLPSVPAIAPNRFHA